MSYQEVGIKVVCSVRLVYRDIIGSNLIGV